MKVKIIFETQTGTTQYVAETLQQMLTKMGHSVDLHSVRSAGYEPHLENYEVVLFGAPTYDDGKLETAMRVFITRFNADLSHHKVAVFGLGNSSYPKFCESAPILEEWIKKNNGAPVVPALKIDGFPDNLAPVEQWVQQLQSALGAPAP